MKTRTPEEIKRELKKLVNLVKILKIDKILNGRVQFQTDDKINYNKMLNLKKRIITEENVKQWNKQLEELGEDIKI